MIKSSLHAQLLTLPFRSMLFFLTYYLWIAPHILQGICLWMFLRRGLGKQFPFFCSLHAV